MTLTWAQAFGATLLLELPVIVALAPRALRRRAILDGAFQDGVLANLFTHPLAWWLWHEGYLGASLGGWLLLEAGVVAVEWAIYRAVTGIAPARAFAMALLANGFSAGMGLLLQHSALT